MLIEWPARAIAALVAILYIIAAMAATIYAGQIAGEYVWRRTLPQIGVVAGFVVACYVGAVLYRAQHWAAFELLNAWSD